MYKCPQCEYEINQATEVCPHCGTDLEALAAEALAAEPAKPRSAAKLILIWAAVVVIVSVGLYSFIYYVLPERAGNQSRAHVEARVLESLGEFQAALDIFARAEGGHYPDSAETLGVPGRLAARNALELGYTLQYTPGAVGPGGGAQNYTLTARPDRYGFRSFYTDQTRIVHVTSENRSATAQDPAL
ncbi:MAG TPA: hypothetical protein VEU31_00585 [Candidatus Acidoferrales bacterium]|nr:hypothetical protein [Candidatus Acidoferrales bacterium]